MKNLGQPSAALLFWTDIPAEVPALLDDLLDFRGKSAGYSSGSASTAGRLA